MKKAVIISILGIIASCACAQTATYKAVTVEIDGTIFWPTNFWSVNKVVALAQLEIDTMAAEAAADYYDSTEVDDLLDAKAGTNDVENLIAFTNSVVTTNSVKDIDWTGATITIADGSASNSPASYGQLTAGLLTKAGTGTVAAIDGRVTDIESGTNLWATVAASMTNFVAVSSSSNYLYYDPATRIMTGCVTNTGSGSGDASAWYTYAQSGLVFRTYTVTNSIVVTQSANTNEYVAGVYTNLNGLTGTNAVYTNAASVMSIVWSVAPENLWYINTTNNTPAYYLDNSNAPIGTWTADFAEAPVPTSAWYVGTNWYGLDSNGEFVVTTNGTTTRYPLAEIDRLKSGTSTWNQAATDAGTISGRVDLVEARTGTWNTAATDASSATGSIAAISANYIPRATNEPPTAGHVLKAGDTTGTNVYWGAASGGTFTNDGLYGTFTVTGLVNSVDMGITLDANANVIAAVAGTNAALLLRVATFNETTTNFQFSVMTINGATNTAYDVNWQVNSGGGSSEVWSTVAGTTVVTNIYGYAMASNTTMNAGQLNGTNGVYFIYGTNNYWILFE